MARMRMLKPGFFTNESLAEIHPLGRILFQGLWCWADREGRLEDRPRRIKAEILPYDDEADVDMLLDELARRGFILRYTVDDARYIQVVTFTKHQTPHIREAVSTIPAPDMHCAEHVPSTVLGTVLAPLKSLTRTESLSLSLTETDHREEDDRELSASSGADAPAVAVEVKPEVDTALSDLCREVAHAAGATLPASGLRRLLGQHATLEASRLIFEVEMAAEWIADPGRNKRKRKMSLAFLHNWLNKTEESRPMPMPARARSRSAQADAGEDEPHVPVGNYAPPESEPLPPVSLAGYQETPKLWGSIAADLRKALPSAALFDTTFGGARLMMPQRAAPPGGAEETMTVPTLVLHSRAALEQSDRYVKQLTSAFERVAPQITSLRRVCRAQVTAATASELEPVQVVG